MKLATWNVNSIRVRQERVVQWLKTNQPDVLCLQELKAMDERFPYQAVLDLGYHAAVFGQPTYNGVAILSRTPPDNVQKGFEDGVDDTHARLIAATVNGVQVISAYFPNGSEVGSPKYVYKLEWMKRLRSWLERNASAEQPLALLGDFNVAPEDIDVAFPEQWKDTVLCHAEVRQALTTIREWGLVDAFRLKHAEGGLYSWWDYRMLAFAKNNGLRIDHIYVTKPLVARLVDASIDRNERKGSQPSDHVPVMIEIN